MTDLRAGATHLILPTLGTPEERKGRFLDAVRKAAAGEFEILGELGRRPEGGIAYLARDLTQPRLVALRFELTPGSQHDYVLDVLQELDSSLPASGLGCPRCGKPLRGWGRYCPGCGYDLSGSSASNLSVSGGDPLRSVREMMGEGFQVLGQMRRAEGGGMIYFARETGRDTIVGFRVKEEEGRGPALDRTAVIPSLSEELERAGGGGPSSPAQEGPARPSSVQQGPAGAPPSAAGEEERPIPRPPVSRAESPAGRSAPPLSWPLVALVILATLAVGLILGVFLS